MGVITGKLIDEGGARCDIRAYGASVDGGTDDTNALLSAIADAKQTGRRVFIPGQCAISRTIEIDGSDGKPVCIEGYSDGSGIQGGIQSDGTGSSLKWIGPLTDGSERPMVRFKLCNKNGHGLSNIQLDCNERNAHGLEVDMSTYGRYDRVSIDRLAVGTNGWGVKLWTSSQSNTCSWNWFNQLYINAQRAGVHCGTGLLLTGGSGEWADSCANHFDNLMIRHASPGVGLELAFTDNNSFGGYTWIENTNKVPGAASVFCNYQNPSGGSMPNHNVFGYLCCDGWVNSEGCINEARGNMVFHMDTVGVPPPVIKSGRLSWIDDGGGMHGFTGSSNEILGDEIDWSVADLHYKGLTDHTTFSFKNIQTKSIKVIIFGSGYDLMFPLHVSFMGVTEIPVRWKDGVPPRETTYGGWDMYEFIYSDIAPRAVLATASTF